MPLTYPPKISNAMYGIAFQMLAFRSKILPCPSRKEIRRQMVITDIGYMFK